MNFSWNINSTGKINFTEDTAKFILQWALDMQEDDFLEKPAEKQREQAELDRGKYLFRFYSEAIALSLTVVCLGSILITGKSMFRTVFSMKCVIQIILNVVSFAYSARIYSLIMKEEEQNVYVKTMADSTKHAMTSFQQCFTLLLIHELYKMLTELKILMTQILKKTFLAILATGLAYGADRALLYKILPFDIDKNPLWRTDKNPLWRIVLEELDPFMYLLVLFNTLAILFCTWKLIASIRESRQFRERISEQNGTRPSNNFSFLIITVMITALFQVLKLVSYTVEVYLSVLNDIWFKQCVMKSSNIIGIDGCFNDNLDRSVDTMLFLEIYLSYVSEIPLITAMMVGKKIREAMNGRSQEIQEIQETA